MATVDEVTGKVMYSKWTTGTLPEFDTPDVPGYTPSRNRVDQDQVTDGYQDPQIEISYTPNDQQGKISYVDKQGHEVTSTPLNGKTDERVTIKTKAPAGWKIVLGQNIPASEKATANGIPTVTVNVEHATTTVQPTDPKTPADTLPDNPGQKYPEGVDEKDLNQTVTRTITVHDPHTGDHQTTQRAHLTRMATVDEVTGKVMYSKWTTGTLPEFDTPDVPGYTPSRKRVDQDQVTDGYQDPQVKISYTPNDQQGKIYYVDVDDHGKEVGQTPLEGKTDQEVTVTPEIPTGFEEVPGQHLPTTVKAGTDKVPTVTVKVQHKKVTVTPDQPKTPADNLPDNPDKKYPEGLAETDLNQTITRTIIVNDPYTGSHRKVQTVHLTRTATVDEVTGEVTYGNWSTGMLPEFDTPAVAGYTPSQAVVPSMLVNAGDHDSTVTITYHANASRSGVVNDQPVEATNASRGRSANPQSTLPQTGNEHSAGLISLGVASLLGMMGLLGGHRQKNE